MRPGNGVGSVRLAGLDGVLQLVGLGLDGVASKVEVELGLQLKQRPGELESDDDDEVNHSLDGIAAVLQSAGVDGLGLLDGFSFSRGSLLSGGFGGGSLSAGLGSSFGGRGSLSSGRGLSSNSRGGVGNGSGGLSRGDGGLGFVGHFVYDGTRDWKQESGWRESLEDDEDGTERRAERKGLRGSSSY